MPVSPRLVGLLYLVIIICGVTSEAVFRAAFRADPSLVSQGAGHLRLSMLADLVMALADVGLAILLLALLRRFGEWLAIGATAFRLVQAAGIAAGLGWLMAAILDAPRTAMWLSIHETGYDVSLGFFAVNCLLTGILLHRAGVAWLGWAIGLSGVVYGTGSILRLIAPDLATVFAPAYGLPLLAESAFCIWLLSGAPALSQQRQ
ncbi:DUF4386 domain-containing protein [Roseovarius sp. A21]|uniref:DUF4386 domain-containing protein n=1 Tax=Roseovarius bejariae TaxID=2576383 RepID=A0A844D4B7_9RHOB|nr:DUF4386 domain-containing protein [Roseovarius bejariae]MRU16108.1 DUF4386 domain-containing protein [Roseovarius bejariae]